MVIILYPVLYLHAFCFFVCAFLKKPHKLRKTSREILTFSYPPFSHLNTLQQKTSYLSILEYLKIQYLKPAGGYVFKNIILNALVSPYALSELFLNVFVKYVS